MGGQPQSGENPGDASIQVSVKKYVSLLLRKNKTSTAGGVAIPTSNNDDSDTNTNSSFVW